MANALSPADVERLVDVALAFPPATVLIEVGGAMFARLERAASNRRVPLHGGLVSAGRITLLGIVLQTNDAIPTDVLIATDADRHIVAVVRLDDRVTAAVPASDAERYHG